MSTNRRWTLSLAVANGGALAAIAARLVSDNRSEAVAALLMPSCWLFAVGLLSAGLINVITVHRYELARTYWTTLQNRFEEEVEGAEMPDLDLEPGLFWWKVETAAEWVSAACFAGGLLYPMAVMCHRYLTSASGFYP